MPLRLPESKKNSGRKINEVYAEFELEPIAAASLGQVYRAKLHTGEEVAVKVQRPNLEATIKGDIEFVAKNRQICRTISATERKCGLGGNASGI